MRIITYNNSAVNLHFEFPENWKAADISSVSLTINDKDGEELAAASNLTLYTATTLDEDVSSFLSSLPLDSGAGALVPGDRISIAGIVGEEKRFVKAYDATNTTVEVTEILDNDHAEDAAVIGLFGNIEIDFSNTTTFPAGQELVLIWSPTGSDDGDITELAQIAITSLNVAGLSEDFLILYPRAHDAFTTPTDNLSKMMDIAKRQIRQELLSHNMDFYRIIDQDITAPAIMAKMAYLWCLNGDIDKEDERKHISQEYDRQITILTSLPIWTDTNQDLKEDESEVNDHIPTFQKGW